MKKPSWEWLVLGSVVLAAMGWVAAPSADVLMKRLLGAKDYDLRGQYCSDPVLRPYLRNISSGKVLPIEQFKYAYATTNRFVLANTGQKTLNGTEVQIVLQPGEDGKIVDLAVMFESVLADHKLDLVSTGSMRGFVLKLKDFNPRDEISFKIEALGPLTISASAKAEGITMQEVHTEGCANWSRQSYGGVLVFRETAPECTAQHGLGIHCEMSGVLTVPKNAELGESEVVWAVAKP